MTEKRHTPVPIEVLDRLLFRVTVSEAGRGRPPGWIVSHSSPETRDALSRLTSDDVAKMRMWHAGAYVRHLREGRWKR